VWLQRQLGVSPVVHPADQCPALRAWYRTFAADAVSIHFASAYLESPSSAFGHTFLRFSRNGVPTLLSPTSNYAADTSSDGGLRYVLYGLLGRYPGVADQLPFFRRVRTYSDDEGRDIWEYPLDLDAGQIDLLLLHLWEVKDGIYDYWFLGENCSYRTLELVAVARPDLHLMDEFPFETAPIETIRLLQDKGLLGEPTRWPSSVRTLTWNLRNFSHRERREVLDIAEGRRAPEDVAGATAESRARILSAAADYSSILIQRGLLDLDTRDRVTGALIRARMELATPAAEDPPPPTARPDSSHGGRMLSAAWFRQGNRDGIELGATLFQHERLDPVRGYESGTDIQALGGRLRIDEDGDVDVESVTLLRVGSNVPSTMLFQRPAWSARLGAERKFVGNDRALVAELGYSRGIAINVGVGVLSMTLGGNIDAGTEIRGAMSIEAVGSIDLTRQTEWASWQLFAEQGIYVVGESSYRYEYGFRLGVPLSQRWNVVLELERAGARRSQDGLILGIRRFF
jgi:hypothetical protein